jgi:uncharacterized protein (DUF697 family)
MKLLLSPSQLDDALYRVRWYLFVGLPVLVGVFVVGWGPVMTPMMAVMLGAMSGVFGQEWRKRGMWMLAAAFLLMVGPTYAILAIMGWTASKQNLSVLQIVDFSVGTAILAKPAVCCCLSWYTPKRCQEPFCQNSRGGGAANAAYSAKRYPDILLERREAVALVEA